jgi:hypothetical protein
MLGIAAAARSFRGGVPLEAERLGIESLGEVPLDPTIRKTSGAGTPITVAEPDNPAIGTSCWRRR